MFKPGDEFRVECYDWTGGQIKNDDSATDIKDRRPDQGALSERADRRRGAPSPAICWWSTSSTSACSPDSQWGFTGIFAKENGGGFLDQHFPKARKACWDFHRHLHQLAPHPRCRFAGIMHPGLIGCLPSKELLKKWNDREKKLFEPTPSVSRRLRPCPTAAAGTTTAHMGRMKGAARDAAAKVGARTVRRASTAATVTSRTCRAAHRCYFPVYVKGAGLSMGDIHLSQGDGEITFCGAIEMAGWIDIGVDVIKGGVEKYGIPTRSSDQVRSSLTTRTI